MDGAPLEIEAQGIAGGSDRVGLNIGGAGQVRFTRLSSREGQVRSDSGRLRVEDGDTGHHLSFHTPGFAIRVDSQDRSPRPGFDARAFTLDGRFRLDLTADRAFIGAYVLESNPFKVIASDPGGTADNTNGAGRRTVDEQGIRRTLPQIQALGGLVAGGAPAATSDLVRVADELFDGLDQAADEEDRRRRRPGQSE